MKILSWNIRAGGSYHWEQATVLAAHNADVIVLAEYRKERSAPLTDYLASFGWPHFIASPTEGVGDGVALVSQHPFERRPSPFGEVPFRSQPPATKNFGWAHPPFPMLERWGVEVQVGDLSIIGVSVPSGIHLEVCRTVLSEAIERIATTRRDDPVVLIGNFNTDAEPGRGPFAWDCSAGLEALSKLGWIDAWRAANPGVGDFSSGNERAKSPAGWRLDHAFVSPVLASAIKSCRYSHEEREKRRLSHHSILILELA